MIIAVDFDGTLKLNDKEPNINLIQVLKKKQKLGDCVILWTCREGENLIDAIRFLSNYGFIPNYANKNHPSIIKKFGKDTRKIYADIYIDDKNIII